MKHLLRGAPISKQDTPSGRDTAKMTSASARESILARRSSMKDVHHNDQPLDAAQEEREDNRSSLILTIPQVAHRLNICRAHVYKLISQGLPTLRLGRSVRIREVSLQAWLLEREEKH